MASVGCSRGFWVAGTLFTMFGAMLVDPRYGLVALGFCILTAGVQQTLERIEPAAKE